MSDHYDCVIIGGGLIGITTAIALAKKMPWKIALLDAKPLKVASPNQTEDPLDTRTLALNYSSIEYLKQLELWPELATECTSIQKVHISEQGHFGSCQLSAEDVGYPQLGAVIEISTLQRTLLHSLKQQQHISCLHQINVLKLNKTALHWQLDVQHHDQTKTINAQYVILADGSNSLLREQLGIACNQFDYQQIAIVAVAHCTKPHQHIAYERFCGSKTLAVLPLSQQRIGTVLTVPQQESIHYLQQDSSNYLATLQAILSYRLGTLTKIGMRQHYPLQLKHAKKFVLDHLILLGNTAHTLNPIGAQGLNLGLAGVKDFIATLSSDGDLTQFEQRQQARFNHLKSFTHQTNQFFSSEAWLTQYSRRLALIGLQHHTTKKNKFTRQMMGLNLSMEH